MTPTLALAAKLGRISWCLLCSSTIYSLTYLFCEKVSFRCAREDHIDPGTLLVFYVGFELKQRCHNVCASNVNDQWDSTLQIKPSVQLFSWHAMVYVHQPPS